MNGRLESKMKVEAKIRRMLEDAPSELTDFYYNISVDKEPKTCVEYIYKAKGFLDTVDKPVAEVTDTDVARYMHSIEVRETATGELKQTSFAYRKMVYTVINSFFNYLYKANKISSNPVACINRPKNTDDIKRRKITSDDFRKILDQVEEGAGSDRAKERQLKWKTRDNAIFTLFMSTGVRETALTEINLADIDFEVGTIKVTDKRHKTHVYQMGGKLEAAIKAWLVDREKLLGGVEAEALFISNRRQRMCANSVAAIVKKYTAVALEKGISPHKIRAGFCSILYEQTGDIEFVRDAVGHASVTTTQRYVVKDDTARLKAASIMNDLI